MRKLLILPIALVVWVCTAVRADAGCPYTQTVATWYARYLHRAPDPAGLASWSQQLRCGLPVARAEALFLASDEYYARAGCCPRGWVRQLYVDVLGRVPAPCEVENWVGVLQRCGCRQKTACAFLPAAHCELARRPPLPPPPPAYGPGYPPGGQPGSVPPPGAEPPVPAGLSGPARGYWR